jgi:hypothetical protein
MKWPTLLLIAGIALVFNACQRHDMQELQLLHPAEAAGGAKESVNSDGKKEAAPKPEAEKKTP